MAGILRFFFLGVSQKGSRERCLPVFFFSENETEENENKIRKKKIETRKKTAKKGQKRKKLKKTEENGRNRKRDRSGDPFCEIPMCFRTHRCRLKTFGENFGALFVRNFLAPRNISCKLRSADVPLQEDLNGEKLTVKKWWIFGADFFTVWCRFFHGLRRFFTVCKGHKR